jgi:N-sulfoglucosamine sulfohydrolase
MNILLITADDMNWDAVGAFGCRTSGTTPNIDRLARGGVCFQHAHVTISVCQPSRNCLMTGRYPHRSGGEGFFRLRHAGIPILPQLLRQAGYRVGILGKVSHSTPYASFEWDETIDMPELGMGRNPQTYGTRAAAFFREAQQREEPFFLMANSHDPHRPFFGNDRREWYGPDQSPPACRPSRVFAAGEVAVPQFLPDLPEVRQEIAEYYGSVRRCDDTVGELLGALEASGEADRTMVMFLSDNGMSFPFAKTNCYLHSTRTPWIVRLPGEGLSGATDTKHFISGVDLLPTLLDIAGVAVPSGLDGQSFRPLLRGQRQDGRDYVFTQFYQTSAKRNYPMRCVQDRRFGYIFNPWSDGQRTFRNESQSGRTMTAMQQAAATDPCISERVAMFLYRVPEEFYDFHNDPDALRNIVDEPEHSDELDRLRSALVDWMTRTDDPALDSFLRRDDPQARQALMHMQAWAIGQRVQKPSI